MPRRVTLWHGGRGVIAGLVVDGTATVAGNSHAILVAVIGAISAVVVAVGAPIVKSWWEMRHGGDLEARLLREITRKDQRISALEAELDRRRERDEA